MSKVPQFIRTLFQTFPLYSYPPLTTGGNVHEDKPYQLYVYNEKEDWPTDPDGMKALLLLEYLKVDYNLMVGSHHISDEGTLPYLIENLKNKVVVYKTEEDIERKLIQWDADSEIYRNWINRCLGNAFMAQVVTNPSLAAAIYGGDQDKKLPGFIKDSSWKFWIQKAQSSLNVQGYSVFNWDKYPKIKQADLDDILMGAVECFKGVEVLLQESSSGFLGEQVGPLDIIVYSYIRSILIWMSHSELGLSVPQILIQHSNLCQEWIRDRQ